MYEAYDDRGKIFTQVVSKRPVAVIIQTGLHRIEGNIHVRQDLRLKDEIDDSGPFVAITDATIFDQTGQRILQLNFLVVQRSHIVWLAPREQE